jgi:hypothetical protein
MKFFALVALALVASANAAQLAWGSAARKGTSLALGAPMALAGSIEFKVTPTTKVPNNGWIQFTASQKTWTNDGVTACTCVNADGDANCAGAVSGGGGLVLKVTVAADKELAATKEVTITCTDNLANLATAAAVTFNVIGSADTDTRDGNAGYTVNAGTATWTSAARTPLGVAQTNGNLVLSFSTRNALAADGTFKATASAALFAENGAAKTTCTATCGGTANVVKSSTVATKRSLTVVLTDVCAAATAVVATCTGNLVNPAAAAITFGFETSGDIVALTTQTGFTTTAATSPIWTSASRSGFLGTAQDGGNLVVKFTPFKAVAATETVTITPSVNIFTGDAATTCTATSDGTAQTVTAATVGAALTVTLAAGKSLTANKPVVITCSTNLKANEVGAVTFSLATTGDATAITGQTGYTVLAGKQVTWTSAARASLETGKGGDLVVKFTPTTEVPATGTVTLTASSAIFTGDAATTCTATSDGAAQTVTAAVTGTQTILTVTLAADKKLTATKAAVITCSSNLAVNGAKDTKVTFDIVTSADTAKVSAATGYTVIAAVTPTKAPTAKAAAGNKTATVAAASTDGVNAGVAFTALCLAATALRQ